MFCHGVPQTGTGFYFWQDGQHSAEARSPGQASASTASSPVPLSSLCFPRSETPKSIPKHKNPAQCHLAKGLSCATTLLFPNNLSLIAADSEPHPNVAVTRRGGKGFHPDPALINRASRAAH